MNNKDKVDFDLDFLDQNTKEKPKSKDPDWVFHGSNNAKNPPFAKKEIPWLSAKAWLWTIGIVVVLAIFGALSDSGSSSTPSSSGSTYVSPSAITKDGYTCSKNDSDQADSLDPDINNTIIRAIDADSAALDQRSTAMNQERDRIDSEKDYADQDTYNADVASYNASITQYKSDIVALNARIHAYNASEVARNSYLSQHCTKD